MRHAWVGDASDVGRTCCFGGGSERGTDKLRVADS